MKKTLTVVFFMITNTAFTNEWSRFIISQNRDDVTISFRQQKNDDAWSVEWRVNNKGQDQIEPLLLKRNYICTDDHIQKLGEISLGIYAPNSQRSGDVTDINICPKSRIKLVEIKTEIMLISPTSN